MSSGNKRKRDEEDSDYEDPVPGRQILPVANLPDDYNGPITDGLQYLFTVRRDARRLPHTVRAANPYEVPEVPRPKLNTEPQRHPSLPSDEWRDIFVTRFKNFRKNVMQPTIHVHIPHNRKQKLLPDRNERDLWWEFIAGSPESVWNRPKKQKQPRNRHPYRPKGMRAFSEESYASEVRDASFSREEEPFASAAASEEFSIGLRATEDRNPGNSSADRTPSDTLPTPRTTPFPSVPQELTPASDIHEGNTRLVPREPVPQLLSPIDHSLAIHLLMYFTNWMNHYLRHSEDTANRLTDVHARWIFALLTRIEDDLCADDMSLLRNLARACTGLVKEHVWKKSLLASAGVGQEETRTSEPLMGERSCWMIIAAIVGVWGQRDLWMDAESMLAGIASEVP
ncbi:hypothetical protein JAAARDRAFT_118826 [Jaapia argillacea MUCL 33604]|uniref:Uncharacterized protein n=1 Tax=Jaapia argillacea MUCL 33604 TaxID=933084 RepID=A0A067QBE9_9AGAM|nr:hypothetical protein JAAARDRAFT_118826 [Jaapia argillacea MUCL 33604]